MTDSAYHPNPRVRLVRALALRHLYPWTTRKIQRQMMHEAIRLHLRELRTEKLVEALCG